MNTAAGEWAAKVAARNEIETAKARREILSHAESRSRGEEIRLLPLSAGPLTQEQKDLRDSPLGMTLGLYR